MKKEIEVWVHPNTIKNINNNMLDSGSIFGDDQGLCVKARLILELPERKIEITESDLRKCFDTFKHLNNDHDRRLVYSFYEFSKQKLFGSERD